MAEKIYDVVVVGGGISGLVTAYYLLKRLHSLSLLLVEASPRLGGTMQTRHVEGFIIEEGPNGFLDNKPHTLNLVKDLGIEGELYPSSPVTNKRFIYTRGRLRPVPLSPLAFFLSPLLSPWGKIRLLMEYFVKPAPPDADETLAQFAIRRLGRGALETLLDPMVAGVYAGNPDKVSLKSTFPTIHQLEQKYGGLIRGFLALKREGNIQGGPGGPGGRLTSFKEGVGQLIKALGEILGDRVLTGVRALEVRREKGLYAVETPQGTLGTRALVLANPAYEAGKMLMALAPSLSRDLAAIPYAPVSVVALVHRDTDTLRFPPRGFGFLVPRREGLSILGVLWDSSIFPNRAPEGKVLMRAMVGGDRQPSLALESPERLVEMVCKDLLHTMSISASPELIQVFQHDKGIPQYAVGHSARIQRIEREMEKLPGLFLNSNAYRGIGLNDCVANSIAISEKVGAFLTS
jgi:oxygen-dependent protoporphyrinogen oxidase